MNIIDYILLGIVILYALLGLATGTLSQILSLITLAISVIAGYLYYEKYGNLLLLPVVLIVTAIVSKIFIHILRKILLSRPHDKGSISFPSRLLGSLISGFKGIIFALIILSSLHLFGGFWKKINPYLDEYLLKSFFYQKFKSAMEFTGSEVATKVHYANKILNEEVKQPSPEVEEVLSELKENPSFSALLEDKQLMNDIQNKQYKKVLTNPKFLSLLKDKDFVQKLYSIDFEELYNKIKQEQ